MSMPDLCRVAVRSLPGLAGLVLFGAALSASCGGSTAPDGTGGEAAASPDGAGGEAAATLDGVAVEMHFNPG